MLSLRHYNTAGDLIAIYDNWRSLDFTRKLNDVGESTISIDDKYNTNFALDSLLEVYYSPIPGTWNYEETFFHRTGQRELTDRDTPIFTSYGRSLNDLLRRRVIAWYATRPQTLKSDPAETVIKEFVNENAGPGAIYDGTAAGRRMPGVFPHLIIETDSGLGPTWKGQRSYKNLLEVIQEIADSTSVDFSIVRTSSNNLEFRCYYPQYGTDRRSTVTFSTSFGNMVTPSYTLSRTEECTQVLVLGGDQETSRKNLYRQSTAINDSPWNTIEDTVSNNQEDGSGPSILRMQQTGDDKLEQTKAQESFTFQVQQTYGLKYGRDYFLGDLVTARFNDIVRDVKIIGTHMNVAEGKETVEVEFKVI